MAFFGGRKGRQGNRDENGTGVPEIRGLLAKAEKGYVAAMYQLGMMYQEGAAVPRDHKEAAEWFRQAAERTGDDYVMFCLDTLRKAGVYGSDDHEEKAKLFRKVAEMNLFDLGLGARPEAEEEMWFTLAAENGNEYEQQMLGFFLQEKGDYEGSVKWIRLAAEGGHLMAQRNLGWMYENGKGVPQDYGEAIKWFRLAAEQGGAANREELNEVIKRYELAKGPEDRTN